MTDDGGHSSRRWERGRAFESLREAAARSPFATFFASLSAAVHHVRELVTKWEPQVHTLGTPAAVASLDEALATQASIEVAMGDLVAQIKRFANLGVAPHEVSLGDEPPRSISPIHRGDSSRRYLNHGR